MTQNVRLQNLRDFTVQIRNDADQIVGTGISVSMKGGIITCRHVVQSAIQHSNIEGAEVGVYFPQVRGGEEKKRRAVVEKYFPDHDDDVVLLQLKDGESPLAPEQIAMLGVAESSDGNRFRSYGYRKLDKYLAGWADGEIQGSVEAPENFNVQCDPIQLTSEQINAGMSGSAVLDTTRNLVVGIVSETWFPDSSTKDRDTAWAVDGRVLSFDPFDVLLYDMPVPLKAAPEPKFDIAQAEAAVFIKEKYSWNSAPPVLPEWTGRDELLNQITDDWNDPTKHVTGLIGFGGEGKSSLARKWVESLENSIGQAFDGLFWWGFYENRSIDEFLEAALNFLSGGRIDPRQVPSSSLRAQIIGAMLGAGRYLFVLDGLEVLQHQEGDQYGLLTSNDLRDLLTYFARPDNQSFCLITSRAPLLDLMEYTTYTHRDVERLSTTDGRALFRRLGVTGSDTQLDQAVSDWDGHALTISLLGGYLVETFHGDIAHIVDIPTPTSDEPRYARVNRVLRRYNDHLNTQEYIFLMVFSAFRTPVDNDAISIVFKKDGSEGFLSPVAALDRESIQNLIQHLIMYRLIKYDNYLKLYSAHPLVRSHYYSLLSSNQNNVELTHDRVKNSYFIKADPILQSKSDEYSLSSLIPVVPPTLDELSPLVEVVYHACRAKKFSDAWDIYWTHISQGERFMILNQLGAYETALELMMEFFPERDIHEDPQIDDLKIKRFILQISGFCLMSSGRLNEAGVFFERSNEIAVFVQDWFNASVGYINLSQLYAHLGNTALSLESAKQALRLAKQTNEKFGLVQPLAYLGWAYHLLGMVDDASQSFDKAELEQRSSRSQLRFLYSTPGIRHSDHLIRIGNISRAKEINDENLKVCERLYSLADISRIQRVFGDLTSKQGSFEEAGRHYQTSIDVAKTTSARDAFIEACQAHGRWAARYGELANSEHALLLAFSDLVEALSFAVDGGYRIYEVDIRVALAWAHLAKDEIEHAKNEALRALSMSEDMEYYWGKSDAKEVLEKTSK